MLIDSHTHLNFKAFANDWKEVVERAIKAGVGKMMVVGTDLASSRKAVELAEKHEALYASVGVHPHHVRGIEKGKLKIENVKRELERLARYKKVAAIGEVGLDYHAYKKSKYHKKIKNPQYQSVRGKQKSKIKNQDNLKNLQKKLLGMQVELAKELGKPLIIHSREAGEEVLGVIEHFSKSDGKLPQGVWHCFDGSKKYLKKIIEAHFYVSFTGNITYVPDRAQVAKAVPLRRLLLETDCPFMPPLHPFRGNAQTAGLAVSQAGNYGGQAFDKNGSGKRFPRRSEPKDVTMVARFHANEREINLAELISQTSKNAKELFKSIA